MLLDKKKTLSTKAPMDLTQDDTQSLKTAPSVLVMEQPTKTTTNQDTESYIYSTDPYIVWKPDVVVFDRFEIKRIAIKCLEDRGAPFYEKAIDSLYSSILNPELDTANMTLDTIMSEKEKLKTAYLELMPQLAEQRDTKMNNTLFDAYVKSVDSLFNFDKSDSNPKNVCTGDWLVSNILEDIVDIYNLSRSKKKTDKNGACILGYDGTLALNNPLFN